MMALGMRVRWKIPVYLHQTRAVTADQQKILIMAAIDALQEQNMHVPEVRFDGAATNMLATNKLGCDHENEKYYFEYELGRSLSHYGCKPHARSSSVRFSYIFSG